MKIIRSTQALVQWRLMCDQLAAVVGFVPTMGCLHAGHIALIKAAEKRSDHVVVSIFVNPLQFNSQDDYKGYPLDLESDILKLRSAGVSVVFLPKVEDFYPHGQADALLVNNLPEFNRYFCGTYRVGHFLGVASVLLRFFMLVRPQWVVFGEKDFQQLYLVRYLVKDFSLPIEVCGVPTVREGDGLAMSSRNKNLCTKDRLIAKGFYPLLLAAGKRIQSGTSLSVAKQYAIDQLHQAGFLVEYLGIVTHHDFRGSVVGIGQCLVLAAVYLGKVRLIDNYCFSLNL